MSAFAPRTSTIRALHLLAVLASLTVGHTAMAYMEPVFCTTVTTVPLNLVGHSPAWGSTVTSLSSPPLSVTFDKNIDPSSIKATGAADDNVTLINYNTNERIPVTVTVAGPTVQIKPKSPLKPSSYYRYYVKFIKGFTSLDTCQQPYYNGGHGNNFYTPPAQCTNQTLPGTGSTELKAGQGMNLQVGRRYNLQFDDFFEPYRAYGDGNPNINDTSISKVTIGIGGLSFSDTANLGTSVTAVGFNIQALNVHYDCSKNQWIAQTLNVTTYGWQSQSYQLSNVTISPSLLATKSLSNDRYGAPNDPAGDWAAWYAAWQVSWSPDTP